MKIIKIFLLGVMFSMFGAVWAVPTFDGSFKKKMKKKT